MSPEMMIAVIARLSKDVRLPDATRAAYKCLGSALFEEHLVDAQADAGAVADKIVRLALEPPK